MEEADTPNAYQGTEGLKRAIKELAADCKRQLRIYSPDLSRQVYGDPGFTAELRRMVTEHARSEIRVLLHNSQAPARGGHRLVELGRKLTSYIQFRDLPVAYWHDTVEWVVCDESGVAVRDPAERGEVIYEPDAPMLARRTARTFDRLWELAQPSQHLRNLNI